MLKKEIFITIILIFIISSVSFSQNNLNKVIKAKISWVDTIVNTQDKFIIQNTDILRISDLILQSGKDYIINYRNGIINISRTMFINRSLDTNRIYDLSIEYDLFPYNLKDEYSNFEIVIEKDTLTGDTVQIVSQRKDFIENLFEGTDLNKSGSIYRNFNFGSNRDLSLNSGFRLQLNGKLSSDIEIIATLTDETTPIQPEGNTLKLQELDKVFIEIKSNNVSATIGDIDVTFARSEFINFQRKIQGAKGLGNFNFGNFSVTGAVSRGKFNSNSFNGTDALQGPYRLIGKDNETNILVLSGTERVFLDGVQMIRGEQADYTIDYGLGQITFTNKRLITSNSRIVVEFEYSDKKYSRTLFASNNKLELLSNKLAINFNYVTEVDNKNSTIDFSLSDSDKVILKNAGDDKSKAVKSGVTFAGVDSLGKGKGAYVKVDTLIGSSNYTFYRFNPGNDSAFYNVTFTYVGQGKGDYTQQNIYQYNFVGINKGSYAPVINIPVPTSYQIANVTMEYFSSKEKNFYAFFESAYSFLDNNKFSDIQSSKYGGVAFSGTIGMNQNNFSLLGIKLNSIEFQLKERIINRSFASLDRINSVEFNRDFDVQDSLNVTEELREGRFKMSPFEMFFVQANYFTLKRGDFFNSSRIVTAVDYSSFNPLIPLNLKSTSNFFKIKYSFEKLSSNNDIINTKGSWLKHNGMLEYRKFFGTDFNKSPDIQFTVNINSENKKNGVNTAFSSDSLNYNSFSFLEFIPRLNINKVIGFNLFAEYNYRNDDNPYNGALINFAKSSMKRFGFVYSGIDWLIPSADVTFRNREYSNIGTLSGNQNNNTVLVNSRLRIEPMRSAIQTDLLYNVLSEQTAIVQKLFVLVPKGQGNYIYLGDLNQNGIQDENEFQLVNYDGDYIKINVPTDKYFPTVNLQTSARIYIKPSRFFFIAKNNFIADVINNFSSESYFKIDEKSKDPETNNIYYLHLSKFLNDSNTIAGNQFFQQDFNFFENNFDYSLRLRFIQQKGYSQYSSGNERLLNIQRALRLKLALTKDMVTQLEYVNKTDRNIAPAASVRNRNINSDNFNSDLSYKPIPEVESGLQLNFVKAADYYPVNFTNASINQQILRFVYSFLSVGRIRIEIERDEVLLNTNPENFPYELTSGRVQGKSYFWRAFLDYNLSKNIQATVNYDGRLEGARRVVHTGRAQVTAFF